MFKKLAIGAVIGLACLWVAKKTNVTSYAATAWSLGKQHVHGQIPRDLELARAQHEIQQLDRDYCNLLGPIAEKMAGVKQLEREINTAKANQEQKREELLAMTRAVEANLTPISYQGCTYSTSQARVKLAREFATFKKLEIHLASKEKLLDAEVKNLAATREQLDKLIGQKREFEIRLAQLEAEEAILKVVKIRSPLVTDESRVADIKNTLDRIEHGQQVDQNKHVLQQQYGSKIGDAQPVEPVAAADLSEIRNYLQGVSESAYKAVTTSK
jgi:hypothetical protein